MEGESSKIIYSVRSWKQGGRYQNKTREDCIPVFADVPNILQKGRIYDWNVVVVLGPCGGECRCVRELIRKLCVIYWCWCRLGVMVDVDLRSRKCAFIRPGFFRILVQPFTLRDLATELYNHLVLIEFYSFFVTICHSGAVRSLRTWTATRRWLLEFEEIVLDTPSGVLVLIGEELKTWWGRRLKRWWKSWVERKGNHGGVRAREGKRM